MAIPIEFFSFERFPSFLIFSNNVQSGLNFFNNRTVMKIRFLILCGNLFWIRFEFLIYILPAFPCVVKVL